MSSVEHRSELINERLSAAADELVEVFTQILVKFQEVIDRQRRLLDVIWKPEIKLHRIELPEQHVCNEEEEVLYDQQLCLQEGSSSLDQEDPEPPQIKEEQGELCSSQEGEQLELKQKTESFMLTPTCEESEKDETPIFNPDDTVDLPVISSVVSAPKSDHELLSHNSREAESQDQQRGRKGDSESTTNAKPEVKERLCQRNSPTKSQSDSTISKIDGNTHTDKTFRCDTCKKAFPYKSHLQRHLIIHTGEKPFTCDTCGKRFNRPSSLADHMRIHSGEKPYSCKTCGRRFRHNNTLLSHMRRDHTEKPFSCKTCGKAFIWSSCLALHVNSHSDGKPYTCNTCGKVFTHKSTLNDHVSIHTGEMPYSCKTCGRYFRLSCTLLRHMITHTGERPHSCDTCGKKFSRPARLKAHIRIHTGEKPFSCKICGRDFRFSGGLLIHMRKVHKGEKTL